MEGEHSGTRYVHSLANIEAKVWYSKKKKVYKKQQITTDTGDSETKYSLVLNNFKINFYKTLSNFENYDTINEEKRLTLFSNFYLPIGIVKTINIEQETKEITYTEEELMEITVKEIEEQLKNEISDTKNIVNEQINNFAQEDYIEVEVIYEVLENIGIEEK